MIHDIRKRLWVIFGIALGIILVILFLFLALRQPETPTAPKAASTTPPPSTKSTTGIRPLPPGPLVAPVVENPDDMYLRQLSRIFVERFTSYSNQNDNSHIADVSSLVTARMQQYLQTQAVSESASYNGMTTRVVTERIDKKTTQSATVHVGTQQLVTDASGTKTMYRSGNVALVRQQGVWLVDGWYWEK